MRKPGLYISTKLHLPFIASLTLYCSYYVCIVAYYIYLAILQNNYNTIVCTAKLAEKWTQTDPYSPHTVNSMFSSV